MLIAEIQLVDRRNLIVLYPGQMEQKLRSQLKWIQALIMDIQQIMLVIRHRYIWNHVPLLVSMYG